MCDIVPWMRAAARAHRRSAACRPVHVGAVHVGQHAGLALRRSGTVWAGGHSASLSLSVALLQPDRTSTDEGAIILAMLADAPIDNATVPRNFGVPGQATRWSRAVYSPWVQMDSSWGVVDLSCGELPGRGASHGARLPSSPRAGLDWSGVEERSRGYQRAVLCTAFGGRQPSITAPPQRGWVDETEEGALRTGCKSR